MWIWDKCPDVYLQAPLIAPIPGSVALLLPSAHHADNAETSRVALLQQSKPQCRLPKKIIYSEFYHLRQRAKIGSLRSSQKQASVQPMYQLHRRYIAVMCRLSTRRRRRRWVIPTATAAALRR